MSALERLTELTKSRASGVMTYHGFERHFSPHLVGTTKDGRVVVHGFQFAGHSSKGVITLAKGAAWRFFYLDEIEDLEAPTEYNTTFHPMDLAKSDGGAEYTPPKFIESVIALAPR